MEPFLLYHDKHKEYLTAEINLRLFFFLSLTITRSQKYSRWERENFVTEYWSGDHMPVLAVSTKNMFYTFLIPQFSKSEASEFGLNFTFRLCK